jgi:Mn2+/Fe2+ NRAMP family transporter
MTAPKACDIIMTKTGLASNSGTTKPSRDIKSTMMRYLGSVILPVTVGCIFYLANRKDLMGKYKNTLLSNIILVVIFLFACFMSYLAMKGLRAEILEVLAKP